MAKAAKTTTDHDQIRRWVEARGGHPAHVTQSAGNGDPGILRIDYPGFSGEETLEPIEWDEFFDSFEKNKLAFLYQDAKSSRFSKFVARSSAKRSAAKRTTAKRSAKKASAKKASAKKASSKKVSSKKAASKKAAPRKTASRKTAAKKK